MPNFCVNKLAQENGDHEVHDLDKKNWCLPRLANQLALGYHRSCTTAVAQAKETYPKSNGCRWCAEECHTA